MNQAAIVKQGWLIPDWPAPNNVKAFTTTRHGGVSVAPYESLNLGDHVEDVPMAVARNRQIVGDIAQLPNEPLWLKQVHGTVVMGMDGGGSCYPTADASIALRPKQICVVMTADCLPVLFCNKAGTKVAAAHAGWRGLCDGMLEQTVKTFNEDPSSLLAWIGPGIGPNAFEVGPEVRAEFITVDAQAAVAFRPAVNEGKWLVDLYQIARQRLANVGVKAVYGGDYCTYQDNERFFSFRRDGKTGRMGSFIWMA
ncbi:MAG: peptidoglycan editing factor PgeF [Thiofilum sp.]|uniref:peptidoglycan editing factor PgeF n=1 Tax=Thiofilum sp. TaxID=2212733 RepID=UPI0025F14342|nr:peptidoglycan editing factor PgeF [Thiofilum sp.]MBK8451796.1 peptidoglycan editing factor PgeF [Thiofilum sp.]